MTILFLRVLPFILFFFFSSISAINQYIERQLELSSFSYKGIYVRKISDYNVYLGNLNEDIILNIKTNDYTQYSAKSYCSMGSLCGV